MLNKYQNFIFDLDGTIVNSSNEIIECLKKAFRDANYDIDDSKFSVDLIGPPIKQIIKYITPELDNDETNTIIKNFRQNYDYNENDVSILYDGIYDYLSELKQSNKKLFIATFKPKIPTMRLLKKFDLNMFDDVHTIDKFDKQITKAEMIKDIIDKYNLKKDETVMIGDMVSDITSAKNNHIDGIGVLWGYGRDKTELTKTATYTVKNIKELKCLKLN